MKSKEFSISEAVEIGSEKEEVFISTFEKLLERVNANGPFQWKLLILFLIPLSFWYNVSSSNYVLLMTTPNHHCHVPGRSVTNYTVDEWNNLTIPWETGMDGKPHLSKCKMYNFSHPVEDILSKDYSFLINDSAIACQYGWDYDKSSWTETAVEKFNLVCDRKHLVTLILTLQLSGYAIGTLSLSLISDRFGRKPIFYIAILLNLVFGNILIFVNSFVLFVIIRFLSALAFFSVYQLPYIITIELCSNRLRTIATLTTWFAFMVSHGYLATIAWFLQEWKLFLLATQLPLGLFFLYWRFLPESPRWLLSKGKLEECENVMTKIAASNNVTFIPEMADLIEKASEEEMHRLPPTKIFTSFILLKHLIIISILCSLGLVCAITLNINVHSLKGSVFINYLILRSFEFPGDLFTTFFSSFLGRRLNAILCLILGSTSILIASFLVAETWPLTVACGFAKMFARAEIYGCYIQTGELFPTQLRSTGYGATTIVTMTASITAPLIVALGYSNIRLPYYILFIIFIVGAMLATLLPETMGNPLPQTMKEAKQIGKNHSYFSCRTKGSAYISPAAKNNKLLKHHTEDAEQLNVYRVNKNN